MRGMKRTDLLYRKYAREYLERTSRRKRIGNNFKDFEAPGIHRWLGVTARRCW